MRKGTSLKRAKYEIVRFACKLVSPEGPSKLRGRDPFSARPELVEEAWRERTLCRLSD